MRLVILVMHGLLASCLARGEQAPRDTSLDNGVQEDEDTGSQVDSHLGSFISEMESARQDYLQYYQDQYDEGEELEPETVRDDHQPTLPDEIDLTSDDDGKKREELPPDQQRDHVLGQLGRQLMLTQLYIEEKTRSDGGSGLKQVRTNQHGMKAYDSPHHVNVNSVAALHDHANNIRTVGLGEFIAVLNGVEFRTRHNDYPLKMPVVNNKEYNALQDIPFPDVPQAVLRKKTVEEQIEEMQIWFRRFKDNTISNRDFTKYFKPVLCYLEGAWTYSGKEFEEGFPSDRHQTEASTWFDLQEKIRFTSYTGRKSQAENFSYLPTKILKIVNGSTPVFVQWNYRIACHPIQDSPYLRYNLFTPVDDMAARFARRTNMDQMVASRRARFRLKYDNFYQATLDKIMSQIPGKDNYGGNIEDDVLDSPAYDIRYPNMTLANAAYYHRYFKVKNRGAMGLNTRHRGFSDPTLWVALTTNPKVAPMTFTDCRGQGQSRVCRSSTQRVSYAIPLEVIYLTPLSNWNPYEIEYKGEAGKPWATTVTAPNSKGQYRNGGMTADLAYNGTHSKLFYRTPASFFTNTSNPRYPADTVRENVGVLDKHGNLRVVKASGTRTFLPEIPGVGILRQRWPIMPIHGEGSAVWKELEALKDAVMEMRDHLYLYRTQPPFGGEGGRPAPPRYQFMLATSLNTDVTPHSHTFEMSDEEFRMLANSTQTLTFFTSEDANHRHEVDVKYNHQWNYYFMFKCDGAEFCWDGHYRALNYRLI